MSFVYKLKTLLSIYSFGSPRKFHKFVTLIPSITHLAYSSRLDGSIMFTELHWRTNAYSASLTLQLFE